MSNIGGVIKSIRDIFRKDPGLSGDAQRIEQLGWMIFLKLFEVMLYILILLTLVLLPTKLSTAF
jgi:hypothetical protein